jgi:hypothetical protein
LRECGVGRRQKLLTYWLYAAQFFLLPLCPRTKFKGVETSLMEGIPIRMFKTDRWADFQILVQESILNN